MPHGSADKYCNTLSLIDNLQLFTETSRKLLNGHYQNSDEDFTMTVRCKYKLTMLQSNVLALSLIHMTNCLNSFVLIG